MISSFFFFCLISHFISISIFIMLRVYPSTGKNFECLTSWQRLMIKTAYANGTQGNILIPFRYIITKVFHLCSSLVLFSIPLKLGVMLCASVCVLVDVVKPLVTLMPPIFILFILLIPAQPVYYTQHVYNNSSRTAVLYIFPIRLNVNVLSTSPIQTFKMHLG